MPSLFVSLGTSPAIVPEAFLFPDIAFDAVHVLTTEAPDVTLVRDWFAGHAPGVTLTITRVAGFAAFDSEADHFHFEEVLYRWLLSSGVAPADRYVCLAGGFKTMSAAMQKAAAVLGASEVFHVLCSLPGPQQPTTVGGIDDAHRDGHLRWIRLGPESGWPQLHHESPVTYPLESRIEPDGIRRIWAPDRRFRERLREIVARSHNIAGAWDRLSDLPFPELATWTTADLDWLRQPLDPASSSDRAWIAALPKIELHCHLGGFATHGTALEKVRAAADAPEGLPDLSAPAPPHDWPTPAEPIGLQPYMRLGDDNGSRLLRDPGCLRAQCRDLYASLLAERVVYGEIRCSPNNYSSPGRSAWTVLGEIRSHFQACMDESAAASPKGAPGCHVNLIIIATRKDGGDRSDIARHLSLAITAADQWRTPHTCRVVGVDLAGFEHRQTRASLFATDFEPVHRVGLAVTIHAGENDDAEGIWQAVFKLNARRLGHALHLFQSPDLLRAVADRRIALEMCPAANVQIKGFAPVSSGPSGVRHATYPLHDYLREGVPVTVNTDNPGISAMNLGDNLLLAARLCPALRRLDALRIQRHAIDAAFVQPSERAAILERTQAVLASP